MDNRTAVFIVPDDACEQHIEQWAAHGGCIITRIRRIDRLKIGGKTIHPDPGNHFWLADIVLDEAEV